MKFFLGLELTLKRGCCYTVEHVDAASSDRSVGCAATLVDTRVGRLTVFYRQYTYHLSGFHLFRHRHSTTGLHIAYSISVKRRLKA